MNLSTAASLLLHLLGLPCAAARVLRGQEPNQPPSHQQRKLPPKWARPSSGGSSGSCKIAGERVGIYIGGNSLTQGGIGDSSKLWAQALAAFWHTGARGPPGSGYETTQLNAGGGASYNGDASATYVTLTLSEMQDCYGGELDTLDLLVMPGGSAYEIADALNSAGKAAIKSYLDNGGNYVGFCAGGYYITKGYYWKGYDGAPADNCDEQFCRYEVGGTFSYDQATQDFTEHEWGGTSYHSNLVAYGPLANVFVEGPIEEIAGPWALASNPNAPYDSHVVVPADTNVPLLRQLYYGGATENYIYTNTSAADWGTELAHFRSDSPSDGDLNFPSDLWTLKMADSGNGGKIVISSAHIEASIFHTAIGDAGMTECQNYNNYVFLTRSVIGGILGIALPEYDNTCSESGQSIKDTATLFSSGLAYQTAPRIAGSGGGSNDNTGGSGGGGGGGGECGGSSLLDLIDFDDGNLVGNLSGGADNPWAVNSNAACEGTTNGIRAGVNGSGQAKGVDRISELTLDVPVGATGMTYRYSYPTALDAGDDFHVYVNGVQVKDYETGSGASCALSECISVSPGQVTFRCKSRGNNEICSLDQIQFYG